MADRTSGGVTNRRLRALRALQEQLAKGTKVLTAKQVKKYDIADLKVGEVVALTESDIKRIEKDIHNVSVNLGLIIKPKEEAKAVVQGEKPAPVNEKLTNQQKNRNLLDSKAK